MADPRAIHEFLTGEVEATTLLLGDFVDLDAQSGYTTFKMSVSDLGEVILEDIEYTQDLTTVDKTIIGAINENKSVIGYSYDAYDATTAYSTGDLCIYNNVLYKAKQATTGNLPTNTTYWKETSIADEISEVNGKLIKKGTYTDTTSANGIFQMDTLTQNINIISAISCKGDTICAFYPAYAVNYQGEPQTAWYFNIVSALSGHVPVANEQVTVVYFYIEY